MAALWKPCRVTCFTLTSCSADVLELSMNVILQYNTNLSWMLHHVHHWTVSLFARRPCLTVLLFSMFMTYSLSQQLCVYCTVYRLSLFVSSTRGWFIWYIFCHPVEWRVLDGAVCSFLVYGLQRDPLCLSVSLTKISLWCWRCAVGHGEARAEALTPPRRADSQSLFQLSVSLSLFIAVPLSESSSRDWPALSFQPPWQSASVHPPSELEFVPCWNTRLMLTLHTFGVMLLNLLMPPFF